MSAYRHPDQLQANLKTLRSFARTPTKIERRRQQFIKVPWLWVEALVRAPGQTYRVALLLLHLHWKHGGGPIKLANGMLAIDGVPAESKRLALQDLEQRGLITVKRRGKRSPVVTLLRV